MATTELELVNSALRIVGSRAISAIDDTTSAGAIAGDVLANERDDLLRSYTWNFATARADLSLVDAGVTSPVFEFANAFALPATWIRTISVHDKADPTAFVRYKMEAILLPDASVVRCIVTDAADIYIRYVRTTSIVSLMPAAFQNLLILRLARIFAAGHANSNTLLQLIDKDYREALERARLTDEIEDYPDSMPADFWGATIINAAIRKVNMRRGTGEEATVQSGIVAAELLNQECDDLLRAHPWNFATTRSPLSRLLIPTTMFFGWSYAYYLPTDWLRTVEAYDNATGAGNLPYKLESASTEILLSGRNFDSAVAWTTGTGWSIGSGVASHAAGSASSLSQAVTLEVGGRYRVYFDTSGVSAGSVTPKFTGGTDVTGTVRSVNGTHADELVAVTGNTTFELAATSAFVGSVDNVFLVRMDGEAVPVLLSNSESVWLRYVRQVRLASAMPADFREVLILRMAKIFAAGLQNGVTVVQLLDRELRDALRRAKSTDGIEDYPDERPEGGWIQARRGGWASRGYWGH